MTPGGKFLVPRIILHSELWETKPAWWFKVWMYILANANFKDHNDKLRRGDLFTSYDTIWRDCNLKKEGKTADAIDNVLRFMKKTGLITTYKTTRGVIISVRNYDQIQRFEEFNNDTENDTSNDYATTHERHYKETNVTNVTTYNYPPTSKTGKEKTLGENPNLGTDTQPLSQPYKGKEVGVTTELGSVSQPKQKPPRIILLGNLNKVKKVFDERISKLSPEQLQEEYLSSNTTSCLKAIQYYFWKYKSVFGKEHPLLKLSQLDNCFENFNWIVWKIEDLKLTPSKIDEVLERAIERWFATTSIDANNLNLNHFAGVTKNGTAYSEILERSVEEVLYELEILTTAPKEVHLEDIV